jgi:hypothetical protein
MIWYSNADQAAILASGKAITDWYRAGDPEQKPALYDYKTNKCTPRAPTNDPAWESEAKDIENLKAYTKDVLDCNNFRNMLWSDATHAVFATRGNWAVSWVKYDNTSPVNAEMVYTPRTVTGNWPAAPNTDTNPNTPNDTKILPKCLSKGGYNECTVKLELSEHNLHRLTRAKTPILIHDEKASVKI